MPAFRDMMTGNVAIAGVGRRRRGRRSVGSKHFTELGVGVVHLGAHFGELLRVSSVASRQSEVRWTYLTKNQVLVPSILEWS
jgi:hypothetical protein